jgi:hypothetical protein
VRGVVIAIVEYIFDSAPIRRDVLQHRDEVGDADEADAAAKHLRCEGEPDQRGITAIGGASDGDPVPPRDALAHRPVNGIKKVVVHRTGMFPVARH